MFGREKIRREKLGKEPISKKMSPQSDGCLGLFIAPSMNFKATAFKGRRPQKVSDLVDLDYVG